MSSKMTLSPSEERKRQVLAALVEAILPSQAPSSASVELTPLQRQYWEYSLSTDTVYLDTVQAVIAFKMTTIDKSALTLLVTLLSTAFGTSLLFGTPTLRSFDQWTIVERTLHLHQLQNSAFVARRKIFIGLQKFLCAVAYSYTGPSHMNPYWEAMGFPGSPADQKEDDAHQERVTKAVQRQAPLQLALNASKDHLSKSLAFPTASPTATMACDVVIIGSGSGGSVAASVLAKAGWKVIVLEKSVYKSPDTIALNEAVVLDEQFEQHGFLQTTSGVVSILAGSAVGGGTAINWSCCLPLPDYVKNEWTDTYGILDDDTEYMESLQHVLHALGAADKARVQHNAVNLKLQEGCDALNYEWITTGQGLRDTGDAAAGFIGMGDRYGNKNGGVQTFLLDAVHSGAQIVENCRVDWVLFADGTTSSRPRAIGAECTILGGERVQTLIVTARQAVIVAAGALRSPILLQKSGLRNRHIGRHLRVHPITFVLGFTSPQEPIDAIVGAPMTTACNEFAKGPDKNGYGARLENPCAYPGILAAATPWTSPQVYKSRLLRYRNCMPLMVLQRDSGDGGSVRASRDGGEVVVDYEVSEADKRSMIQCMQGAAKILVAAKMEEVGTGHIRDHGFMALTGNSMDDNDLTTYLDAVASRGLKDHEATMFSAHQMGTCRMTSSPTTGVVDANGETWECDDLFVMDTSLFPTASGSNPMVTALTLSHILSTRLNLMLQLRNSQSDGTVHMESKGSAKLVAADKSKALELVTERRRSRLEDNAGAGNLTYKSMGVWLSVALVLVSVWMLPANRSTQEP